MSIPENLVPGTVWKHIESGSMYRIISFLQIKMHDDEWYQGVLYIPEKGLRTQFARSIESFVDDFGLFIEDEQG